MSRSHAAERVSQNGLPYRRAGRGPRTVFVFQGLQFENRPPSGLEARFTLGFYRLPADEFTTYLVTRQPGLPRGYTMKNMSDDYAAMIREEIQEPVDVIGISTEGSIAQHFAADHPHLVRKLVIHSSAHTLCDAAKKAQMEVGHLAQQGRWREAWAVLLDFMNPPNPAGRLLVWLVSRFMSLSVPKDPSDLVVTVEAEDKHDFRDCLAEITAPTLVVAGDKDPFYSEALFRETAAGIPNARLVLCEGMGHPAAGKQFRRDLLAFLREGVPPASR